MSETSRGQHPRRALPRDVERPQCRCRRRFRIDHYSNHNAFVEDGREGNRSSGRFFHGLPTSRDDGDLSCRYRWLAGSSTGHAP